MEAEEFKKIIIEILEVEIKFDGHLEKIIEIVPKERIESIVSWVKECKLGSIKAEPCKKYRHLMAFIYKSSDNSIRGILTKEKNSYFLELFLDKHKYYDLKREYLGL